MPHARVTVQSSITGFASRLAGDPVQRVVVDGVVDLELEVLALPDVAHTGDPEAVQRPRDGLALRVQDLRLGHHVHHNSGHASSLRGWKSGPMQVTHFGHSCVLLDTGAARLLIDPGNFSQGFEDVTGLDAVLVTHQHPDHLDPERLPALLRGNPDARLIVDSGTAGQLAPTSSTRSSSRARPWRSPARGWRCSAGSTRSSTRTSRGS